MTEKNIKFYFMNLGADVIRCIRAIKNNDESRYLSSLERAYQTLTYIKKAKHYSSYEEGLLMLRGLALAKVDGRVDIYSNQINLMISNLNFS